MDEIQASLSAEGELLCRVTLQLVSDPITVHTQPLYELLPRLREALQASEKLTLDIPDPNLGMNLYAGENVPGGLHRSWQTWADIAERLNAQLLTPQRLDGGRVLLTLRRLLPITRAEGYSLGSDFQRLDKLEDPWFLDTFTEALGRAGLREGARVLAVGVGSGRELDALSLAYPGLGFEVMGVDIDAQVLELARQRHAARGWHFEAGDVNALPETLGHFDLIVALSVLQSRHVNLDLAMRSLIKNHLQPAGAIIIGLPNCRYSGGEVRYGARMLNFRDPDLSLLLADAALVRRHLQKHGFRVWVTGKYEVLVTGVRGG